MLSTIELAKLAARDRDRSAAQAGLRSLARRLAECCRTSFRSRLAASLHRTADSCGPSDQERLARSVRAMNGC